MNKTRTTVLIVLIVAGAGVFLFVLGALVMPKLHYVDQRPAVALGEGYFSKLSEGRIDDAFAMYTDGFLRNRGQQWQRVVGDLDSQAGLVTDSKVMASQVAPVTLSDSTEIPCILVQYKVTRGRLISEEKLTIRPHQRGTKYGIAGHEITRSDNGQHFAAGITVRQKTILSTN